MPRDSVLYHSLSEAHRRNNIQSHNPVMGGNPASHKITKSLILINKCQNRLIFALERSLSGDLAKRYKAGAGRQITRDVAQIFLAIARKITSCTFITRSIAALGRSPCFAWSSTFTA
jgi:hypothetical protein